MRKAVGVGPCDYTIPPRVHRLAYFWCFMSVLSHTSLAWSPRVPCILAYYIPILRTISCPLRSTPVPHPPKVRLFASFPSLILSNHPEPSNIVCLADVQNHQGLVRRIQLGFLMASLRVKRGGERTTTISRITVTSFVFQISAVMVWGPYRAGMVEESFPRKMNGLAP